MPLRSPMLPTLFALAALGVLTLFTTAAVAQDRTSGKAGAAMDPQQRGAIEGVVREYLLANPEVIVDAIRIYREREQQAQEEQAKKALSAHKGTLINDPDAPIAGNPKGDVTVVEFFDYQCGYCKRVLPTLRKLLDTDKNLRWVFKEFPILGRNRWLRRAPPWPPGNWTPPSIWTSMPH